MLGMELPKTRNYLSIGALKRQMVTVQKNEEVALASKKPWLTATGCESNPWKKRGGLLMVTAALATLQSESL